MAERFAHTYSQPVLKGISEPVLIGGVPQNVAYLNGVTGAAIILGLQVWSIGVPLVIAVHLLARYLTKLDPQLFQILGPHLNHLRHYDV